MSRKWQNEENTCDRMKAIAQLNKHTKDFYVFMPTAKKNETENSFRIQSRTTTIVQRVIYGYRIKYMSDWYVGFGTQYGTLQHTFYDFIQMISVFVKCNFCFYYWNWKDGCRCNVFGCKRIPQNCKTRETEHRRLRIQRIHCTGSNEKWQTAAKELQSSSLSFVSFV